MTLKLALLLIVSDLKTFFFVFFPSPHSLLTSALNNSTQPDQGIGSHLTFAQQINSPHDGRLLEQNICDLIMLIDGFINLNRECP